VLVYAPSNIKHSRLVTPLAALGAVCTMIGAIALHIHRKDGAEAIATNLFIIALAVFIAYSRSGLIG
jgi:uncharacterized membrane protein YphA (DoxX/SURF4 family)